MSMANTVTSAIGSGANEAAGSSLGMRLFSSTTSPDCARYPSAVPMATANNASSVNSMMEIASTNPCAAPMHFIKATASMCRAA